jgi:hypothetical protein
MRALSLVALFPKSATKKATKLDFVASDVCRVWHYMFRFDLEFTGDLFITATVQVVVVDVDHFDRLFVFESVRHGPTVDGPLFKVDRALVVSMVQLSHADKRDEPRWIDVIGDLALHDLNVVPLFFVEERNAAANRSGFFQSLHDFVVAWRIKSDYRSTCSDRTHDRDAFVPLMVVEFELFLILEIRTDRNWNSKRAKVDPIGDPDAARCRKHPGGEHQA